MLFLSLTFLLSYNLSKGFSSFESNLPELFGLPDEN